MTEQQNAQKSRPVTDDEVLIPLENEEDGASDLTEFSQRGGDNFSPDLPLCIPVLKFINLYGGQAVPYRIIAQRFMPSPIMETLEHLYTFGCVQFPGENSSSKKFYVTPEGERRLKAAGQYKEPLIQHEPGAEFEPKGPGRPVGSKNRPKSDPAQVGNRNAD